MPGGGVPKSAGDFYESDDPSETTNFILQAASNAGEDWTIETKVLGADLHGGYAQGGLIAYADDDNYVKIDLISPGSRTRPYRIEVRSETGGLARAPRPQVEPLPEGTEDAWLRLTKRGDVYVPAYSLDGENWTTFSQWVGNPIEDPDFGIFAVGVDEPGTEVGFEYFAFDGEVNCGPDTLAPRTSAALDPELPGPGRTYDGPVQVTLEAADASPTETPAAGVAHTEYRVTTNNEIGDWVRVDNVDDADPFVTTLSLDKPGNHVVEFRSADGGGQRRGHALGVVPDRRRRAVPLRRVRRERAAPEVELRAPDLGGAGARGRQPRLPARLRRSRGARSRSSASRSRTATSRSSRSSRPT